MSDRTCEHEGEDECRDCFKARIGSIAVAGSATPSRVTARKRGTKPKDREASNRWERGQPTDHRGMPYLDEKGVRVNTKKLAETRHRYRRHEKIDVS